MFDTASFNKNDYNNEFNSLAATWKQGLDSKGINF